MSNSEASQRKEDKIAEDLELSKSNLNDNLYAKAKLPIKNILADNRRRYNSQDEFVYLLYNDIAKVFLTNWRRNDESQKSLSSIDFQKQSVSNAIEETEFNETSEKDKGGELSDGKLILPDEYIQVEFSNKNNYTGRVSRKQMEGDGVYRWGSGETYKGEFAENSIQGKGNIEWKDLSWYEGEFNKGYRHGIGNLVSHEYERFYIGNWYMGRKHGNGYCRYNDKNDDFYEGEWNMDQRHGTGYRVYQNGTRYIGQWENDKRHGVGTMVWPNGDVYRGEWENGLMNGYGDYVWNGFLNKSLSWPKENCYMGEWLNGMKHGAGVLKLNSSGGAKYSGNWHMDMKHGYGMIVGNNGAVTESDPLFLNNILTDDATVNLSRSNSGESEEFAGRYRKGVRNSPGKRSKMSAQKKHKEARMTTVFQPIQYPTLKFHVQRLLKPQKHPMKSTSIESIASGKCRVCKSDSTCACLYDYSRNGERSKSTGTSFSFEFSSSSSNSLEYHTVGEEKCKVGKIATDRTDEEYEEHWVHNCLITHMPKLRKIYKQYAELYCANDTAIRGDLSMGKMALWQLMRDCGIHKRGMSLAQIERYVASNKSAFIETEFYPFERIEFFQFLHTLLEISWHLYTKLGDVETEVIRGRLAGGLHRLLVNDIFPNAGKLTGNVSTTYRDLLPMYSVYQFYCDVGEPHTAKKFLRSTCVVNGSSIPKPLPWAKPETIDGTPSYFTNGVNAITVGEKLSYIPSEKPLIKSRFPQVPRTYEDDFARELFALRDLGAQKLISIMATICPGIKDSETEMIVNMDYEFTFLEFYEILLEATREFIYTKKKASGEKETLRSSTEVRTEGEALVQSLKSVKSKRISLKNSKTKMK